MKRFIGTGLVLCLAAVAAPAQSVTLTAPGAGAQWKKGESHAILWTKSGSLPDQVRITLRNSNSTTTVREIVDGAPNSGSYQWTPPNDIPAGSYRIRVKVKGADVDDDSELFSLTDGALAMRAAPRSGAEAKPAPRIEVTKPDGSPVRISTTPYAIAWTKAGEMGVRIRILLKDGGGQQTVRTIAANADNSGAFAWTIPGSLPPAKYVVRVETLDGKTTGDSSPFEVLPPLAKADVPRPAARPMTHIHVTAPVNGATYKDGDLVTVWWTFDVEGDQAFVIDLVGEPNGKVINIESEVRRHDLETFGANGLKYSWTYRENDRTPEGDYRIRVRSWEDEVPGPPDASGVVHFTVVPKTEVIRKEVPLTVACRREVHYDRYTEEHWPDSCPEPPNDLDRPGKPGVAGYRFVYQAEGIYWRSCATFYRTELTCGLSGTVTEGTKLKKASLCIVVIDNMPACPDLQAHSASCLDEVGYLKSYTVGGAEKEALYTIAHLVNAKTQCIDVTEVVRHWLDGTLPNRGFLVKGPYDEDNVVPMTISCMSWFNSSLSLEFERTK